MYVLGYCAEKWTRPKYLPHRLWKECVVLLDGRRVFGPETRKACQDWMDAQLWLGSGI